MTLTFTPAGVPGVVPGEVNATKVPTANFANTTPSFSSWFALTVQGGRRERGLGERAPFEAGFIVERSFFRIIANVPNDRGRGSCTRGTPPCDRSQNSDTITGPQQCRATMQHHQHSHEPNPLSVLLLFSFHPLHFHDEAHRAPAVKNLGGVADNGGGRRIRDVATSENDFT